MKLEITCRNCKIPMSSLWGEGDNLQQSGGFKCEKCGATVYVKAQGCIAHLVAINKMSVVLDMNGVAKEKNLKMEVEKCTCDNCQKREIVAQ